MRRIATADPDDAVWSRLVVIDPHTDTALDVLRSVPPELADRAAYLDWSGSGGYMPVCNLLDVHLFGRDIDLHVDRLLTMLKLHWPDMWGPRMESVLRYALLFLYADNQHIERERQHTIVDVLRFIGDSSWRDDLLRRSRDPRLVEMFSHMYRDMTRSMWGAGRASRRKQDTALRFVADHAPHLRPTGIEHGSRRSPRGEGHRGHQHRSE